MLDEIRHRQPVPSAVRRYCCRIARVTDRSGEQGLEIGDQLLVVIQGQEGIVSGVGAGPIAFLRARMLASIDLSMGGIGKAGG